MQYKVLSLTQPWASLVAIGMKKIETRKWATSYRGKLLIHAAAGLGPVGGIRELYELCECEPFHSALRGQDLPHMLPRGAIVAVCRLADVARVDYYEASWEDASVFSDRKSTRLNSSH